MILVYTNWYCIYHKQYTCMCNNALLKHGLVQVYCMCICNHLFLYMYVIICRFMHIMPTLLKTYSNNQPNPVLCQAIEFVCRQFYILHRKPFILQASHHTLYKMKNLFFRHWCIVTDAAAYINLIAILEKKAITQFFLLH